MDLLGAMSAHISLHHKDGLVRMLWISLSLMHIFLTKFSSRGGVRLNKTKLSGVGVSGVFPAANSQLDHYGVHRRHPCS